MIEIWQCLDSSTISWLIYKETPAVKLSEDAKETPRFCGFANEKPYLKGYYFICSKATLPIWKHTCGEELPHWW